MDAAASSGSPAEGDVVLQPQVIPAPRAASPEAQAYLRTPFWAGDRARLDADDIEGWAAAVAQVEQLFKPMLEAMLARSDADVEKTRMGGVAVYVCSPRDLAAKDQDKAHLYIHGGGWAFSGGEACGGLGAVQARQLGYRTYSVDYRTPPVHRFPAALDDCVAVYRELLKSYRPENIVISGGSAGGNLSAATGLRIRDEGLAWPAAIGLLTPCTDGCLISDTHSTNDQLDSVLKAAVMAEFWAVYAGGHDRADPYLSPAYGDYSKGFPPTFLQTGTRDLLLSDTVRLHRAMRRGGAEAELHVWEAMPHGGFGGVSPEDGELTAELKAFFEARLGRSR
jgi:acetyl esterase/lipase